jgi:hypothetical protein
MIVFKLKLTQSSIPWFEDNKVDVYAMEAALSLLFAELEPSTSMKSKILTIQICYGSDESYYLFTTDKLRICDKPDSKANSKKKRQLAFFDHFLHEFRHWMQSRIYKINGNKLNYTEDDVKRNTNAYFKNEYEVDARQFSRTYSKKFMRYYRYFSKIL